MKKRSFFWLFLVFCGLLIFGAGCVQKPKSDYSVKAVPLTDVKFTGGFWAERQEIDRTVTIPHNIQECENTGRVKNFEIAGGTAQGKFCTRYAFDDSDLYKVIEAASYSLALHPDPELDKKVDELIGKIAKAQEPDGYLYTARTIDPKNPPRMSGKERWVNLKDSHELYNLGHLYEAAVAHNQATGKKSLLDVALKSADFIDKTFGPGKDQLKLVPGHEEIEIGLVKLFRLTGKMKYLNLAKFFIDERGNASGHALYGDYAQDHKPVVEQTEAVGHAVRAAYLYSGVTDVAALTGDRRYMDALDKIWDDVVTKKLYLSGGIGAAGGWEGFGPAYDLPNASGYAETCATIAYALWNYRMFLYYGDAKYMDLFERAAYNAFLSGAGLPGDKYFYPNPLASFGQHERSTWFGCACCPPNIARFIAELGGFAYGVAGDNIYVNLYARGTADVKTGTGKVRLEQTTDYPWQGDVKIQVAPEKASSFTLYVRIPEWAQGRPLPSDLYRYADGTEEKPVVKVNGETIPLNIEKGYLPIARPWNEGDTVEISLPMPIHRVAANEKIKADVGRVAIERGPILYCAEWPDNNGLVSNLVLGSQASLTAEMRSDLLGGVMVISGEATAYKAKAGKIVGEKQPLALIPYFAWAHRGKGEMAVWLAGEPKLARPTPEPTVASLAKVSASGGRGVSTINDQFEPENSNDHSVGYFHWWPKKGTTEWVQYDFRGPTLVSEISVYWFDDTGEGECRVPKSWQALFKAGNTWVRVKNIDPYGVDKDAYNTVRFERIRTAAMRLEIQMPEKFSAGIHEWKVK